MTLTDGAFNESSKNLIVTTTPYLKTELSFEDNTTSLLSSISFLQNDDETQTILKFSGEKNAGKPTDMTNAAANQMNFARTLFLTSEYTEETPQSSASEDNTSVTYLLTFEDTDPKNIVAALTKAEAIFPNGAGAEQTIQKTFLDESYLSELQNTVDFLDNKHYAHEKNRVYGGPSEEIRVLG